MTTSNIWDEIQGTRNLEAEERKVSTRLPFGLLHSVDAHWTAHGPGDGDAQYAISVTERHSKGLLAAVIGPRISLTAELRQHFPPDSGQRQEQTTVYNAHLVAGELATIHAVYKEFELGENGQPCGFIRGMDPEFAVNLLDFALSDAKFS